MLSGDYTPGGGLAAEPIGGVFTSTAETALTVGLSVTGPLSEDFDNTEYIKTKFIQISPQAGAGAYVLDVELHDDNQVGTRLDFFINGVASTNPTIRLVKQDGTLIHSEALDGSGDSIRLELILIEDEITEDEDWKLIGRNTL